MHDNDNPELDGPAPTPSEMGPPMMGNSNEVCLDLQALAMPDEQESMTPPEVGDKIQASIEGKVTRIEGDKAYVRLTAVNGQEVAEEQQAPSEDQQFAELQDMARGMPEESIRV